ncbi:TlpA family protein disulfide reductase [Rhodococcus antarcticus]|jgi:thiol-disulfide isomerase/thioredoxin|uniref:TlpA family protein disulfide reductase n=1 Tax=Rhodococcus antarcticus TaxID=2987751 RepID=A0ABY6P0S9_9NOCA|nr:TlpA disulfide reductase family protein [Rhodococcus antarcticus]UZJ25252.1 TlpA family protein disulfide reductase [Rhodococcus antarcticus]
MRARLAVGVLAAALVLSGCSSGSDAVVQGGSFQFVSPGGKTEISYDPPSSRGTIGTLSGPDLLDPTRSVSVDDFAGQVVVLNIWGQWCAPCRVETPELEDVYTATQASGVAFLGLNVKDPNISAPQDYVRDTGITYPSIWDPSYRTLVALGGDFPTSTTPSTVVLDREHRVAQIFIGRVTAAQLRPVVERLAAESPAPSQSPPTTGASSTTVPVPTS